METKVKRKYTKPAKINRIWTKKPYEERLVQGFFYVKGKFYKEAYDEIQKIIQKWR
jgi:hypothetical protein